MVKALQKVLLSSRKDTKDSFFIKSFLSQSRSNFFSGASKEKTSHCCCQCVKICDYSGTSQLQPPSNIPYIYSVLRLDCEWVTLLFTIFPIPSQVFGLAGPAALSLAITGLWGFSNGAFEEITLFSSSSREKPKTFWPGARTVNHTSPV